MYLHLPVGVLLGCLTILPDSSSLSASPAMPRGQATVSVRFRLQCAPALDLTQTNPPDSLHFSWLCHISSYQVLHHAGWTEAGLFGKVTRPARKDRHVTGSLWNHVPDAVPVAVAPELL